MFKKTTFNETCLNWCEQGISLHTARFYVIICVDIDTTVVVVSSICHIDIFKHTNSKELRR